MAKTNLIENLQSVGNLDTDLRYDTSLEQKKQCETIVLLDGDNGSSEIIKDDIDIVYSRKLQNGERTEYEDKDGNKGYKQIYNFGLNEFSGTISQVCLAHCDFIDPRTALTTSSTSGNNIGGGNVEYILNVDYLTKYSKVLDIDVENGTLITFEIKYDNGEWSGVFCKWNHNLRQFRIGGASSYFYLNEVISVDIGDLISIPNNQGGWDAWTEQYGDGNLYCSIDEVNNRYVIVFTERSKKVFNTLILDKEDMTQTTLHKMVLPNEVSWPSNQTWNFRIDNKFWSLYGLMYKGKFAMPLYTVRTEHEQEIQGVYMCLINPEDSTDIKALETHCINNNGEEIDWKSYLPDKIDMPLFNTGCGSAISMKWVVKNDIAYIKQVSGTYDMGFYYKGFMLKTKIFYNQYSHPENTHVQFNWSVCPYTLTFAETLSKPFFKTLNKTLKYTFRIVNTGGNFYGS